MWLAVLSAPRPAPPRPPESHRLRQGKAENVVEGGQPPAPDIRKAFSTLRSGSSQMSGGCKESDVLGLPHLIDILWVAYLSDDNVTNEWHHLTVKESRRFIKL